MAQQHQPRNEIGFKEIQLLKKETLGVGSYGSVCKARCDQLLCAAKIIHPTLVPPNALQQISPQKEHRIPIRRFEMECDILREIKHPNIIQYLGMYLDPETGLPVLLMELMDKSLTHFLKNSIESIPYHIQLTICVDISRALSFLHLNGIIHRDLSSNNILLIGKGRAKLTDFGMAKLVDVRMSRVSNTMCPGTDAYMPPEAIDNQAVYTEKGDVFSFGVNIVQILTRKFPKPGDRFQTVPINDPRFPSGRIRVCVSEIHRRNNHISEINPAHPLLPIALDCLKDQDGERHSAGELCQRLAALTDTPEYTKSEIKHQHQITELHQQLLSQQQEHDEQIQRVITAREQEIQDLREELSTAQATVREKVQIIMTRDQQKRDQEEVVSRFQKRIEELELNSRPQPRAQSLSLSTIARATPLTQPSKFQHYAQHLSLPTSTARTTPPPVPSRGYKSAQNPSSLTDIVRPTPIPIRGCNYTPRPPFTSSVKGVITLTWTQGKKALRVMHRDTDAVVDCTVAYFIPGGTKELYSYNSIPDIWSQLPDCPNSNSTLAIVNGLLTTVGGYNSNKLFSLTGKARGRTWTEVFPPMPTKRDWAIAVTTGTTLIVAGGVGEKGATEKVEIMNTNTHQWATGAYLPQPVYTASATVCSDRIYMSYGKSVITSSLLALLQSCQPKIFEAHPSTTSPQDPVWSRVADLPVERSTLVSINNRLVVLGGHDSANKPTAAVRLYDPVNNSWQTINHLSTARQQCFAVVLPDNRIMVVGGLISGFSSYGETASVEFVSTVDV